jgi:hypothetical protein
MSVDSGNSWLSLQLIIEGIAARISFGRAFVTFDGVGVVAVPVAGGASDGCTLFLALLVPAMISSEGDSYSNSRCCCYTIIISYVCARISLAPWELWSY